MAKTRVESQKKPEVHRDVWVKIRITPEIRESLKQFPLPLGLSLTDQVRELFKRGLTALWMTDLYGPYGLRDPNDDGHL